MTLVDACKWEPLESAVAGAAVDNTVDTPWDKPLDVLPGRLGVDTCDKTLPGAASRTGFACYNYTGQVGIGNQGRRFSCLPCLLRITRQSTEPGHDHLGSCASAIGEHDCGQHFPDVQTDDG